MNKIKQKVKIVLDKTSVIFKTDMTYLAKGAFWLTFYSGFVNIIGFAVSLAFANLFPVDNYGQYRYILSFLSLFLIFSLPGLNTATVRAVARGYEGSVTSGLKIKIKWGLGGSLVSILLSLYYIFNNNIFLGYGFILIGIFLPFLTAGTIIDGIYVGKRLFKESSLIGMPLKVAYSLIIILTLLFTDNVILVLIAYLIVTTLNNFILYFRGLKFKQNDKISSDFISYGKFLTYLQIFATVIDQIDKILIFHYLGATKLAIYLFARLLPEKIKILVSILRKLAIPKFSADDKGIIKAGLQKKVLILTLLLLPIIILYIVTAPLIYKLLLPNYLDAVIYSQIFSLTVLLYPQTMFTTYIRERMKKKQLLLINSISPVVRFVLYLILIPTIGILGAIIAYIIARLFNYILTVYLFKKI